MRPINNQRRLVEQEGHRHSVKRGWLWKLHFENFPRMVRILKFLLNLTFSTPKGIRNAADLKIEEVEFAFNNLPAAFDNTRILLITDLHIDAMDSLFEIIVNAAEKIDYDFCILGGDYSFGCDHENNVAYSQMSQLAQFLAKKSRVFGILGNHDRYNMAQTLEQSGVEMLINDNVCLDRGGDKIYISGLDDCHYYGSDDIALADQNIEQVAFKIMVCHSPERYKEVAKVGYCLYLAGHTHGGQVCLPGGAAPVTGTTTPRRLIKGKWKEKAIAGYTSRGVGVSGLNVRYFCPPEIPVITLLKK